jgi:hypothetical protein
MPLFDASSVRAGLAAAAEGGFEEARAASEVRSLTFPPSAIRIADDVDFDRTAIVLLRYGTALLTIENRLNPDQERRWSCYGYQRACDLISGQISTGHLDRQCSHAPGNEFFEIEIRSQLLRFCQAYRSRIPLAPPVMRTVVFFIFIGVYASWMNVASPQRGHWHAPSATKAHVTGPGIVLCNALPEFALH